MATDGTWPAHCQDLFPHGLARTMDSIVSWWKFIDMPVCSEFIGALLTVAPKPTLSALVQSSSRQTFASTLCKRLQEMGQKVLDERVNWENSTQALSFRAHVIEMVSELTLVERGQSRPLTRALFDGCETQLGLSANILALVGRHPLGHSDVIAALAMELGRCTRPPSPVLPSAPQTRSRSQLPHIYSSLPGSDAYELFSAVMENARGGLPRCASRACRVVGKETGTRLQKCGRCGVFRYCSRQCQKHHWSDVSNPHKDGCALMQKLNAIASFDAIPVTLASRYRSAAVDLTDMVEVLSQVKQVVDDEPWELEDYRRVYMVGLKSK
ncbi:hypothetical protein BKA62DRAFT_715626 [Auriculariales sp. MPI-PUGE-AT-0066]|nr:hypothetical protein BKA62DRAFT_715626 [Auriculariales sp. MPI-PUGE-AT-0066]